MPAPETPQRISIGGSQQQLDAMIAEIIVPTLAISSPRRVVGVVCSVAPGDGRLVPQQSGAGIASSDMYRLLRSTLNRVLNGPRVHCGVEIADCWARG
jgi:hypothetical protein